MMSSRIALQTVQTVVLALVIGGFLGGNVQAQSDWRGYGIMSQHIATGENLREMHEENVRENGAEALKDFSQILRTHIAARRGRATLPSASARATTFRPVAETLVPPRLAAAMTDDPQQQQQRTALLTSLLDYYKDAVAKQRRPANDLSDAAAAFVLLSYQVATNKALTEAQKAPVRQQMKQVIATDAALASMDDRAKQEAFETLVILGLLPEWMARIGEDNKSAELVKQAREIAREQLEEMLGTKLGRIKFTVQGIEF